MTVKKIVSLVLAFLMLSVTFAGCNDKEGEQTEEPKEVFISSDAIGDYAVIRSDEADEDTTAAASKLYFELKKKFGDKITFTTDYAKSESDIPTDHRDQLHQWMSQRFSDQRQCDRLSKHLT